MPPSIDSPNAPALVTGGTGFLGRRLVERLLAQGRPVTVLSRRVAPDLAARGVRCVRRRADDGAAVAAACAGAQTVFHLAARVGVWGRYADFFAANVLGTRAVLAGCRRHGVPRLVYTSTPASSTTARDLAGVDESAPLTTRCPSPYPLTKAMAERRCSAANSAELATVALRPHLIWGAGRSASGAAHAAAGPRRAGCGSSGRGRNRVDMVHVENAVDAHLLAEAALAGPVAGGGPGLLHHQRGARDAVGLDQRAAPRPGGAAGDPPDLRSAAASALGAACEAAWRLCRCAGEPPMTRFVAAELAKDHWFDISAARRDLGYCPADQHGRRHR